LVSSLIYIDIEPFFENTLKRVSKKPKGCFFDTGLLCYLNMIQSPTQLAQHPKNGSIFETYIINQLHSYTKAKMDNIHMYHWRTSAQQEVDLILEYSGILYPIEIKLKSSVTRKDAEGIEAFLQVHKQRSAPMV